MGKTISATAETKYIEVEPNVRLHITDAGEGRAIVLRHGCPLRDEMYEYQYNVLINNNFRMIGIALRGFGKSDNPYGLYGYDVHVPDIKKDIFNNLIRRMVVTVKIHQAGLICS